MVKNTRLIAGVVALICPILWRLRTRQNPGHGTSSEGWGPSTKERILAPISELAVYMDGSWSGFSYD